MHFCWGVACVALALGCEHSPVSASDHGREFIGKWECARGRRDIDCGQGTVVADLALGPANDLEFARAAATALRLLIPVRGLAPGLPGGPTCELVFDAGADEAYLHAESVCTDEDGASIVVHEGTAVLRIDQLALDTSATTSESCVVKTSATCYPIDD